MGDVVGEFSQGTELWANVRVIRWSSGVSLGIEPIAVVVSPCSMVISEDIGRMSNPEACRSLVRVEETPRLLGQDGEVVLKVVVCFNRVFNEESVPHCVVGNVVNNA